MRNVYCKGNKDAELNSRIIDACGLKDYQSKYRILEHFFHVDTYIDERGARLQGYVYPKELHEPNQTCQISIPESEVAYMDDELILFMTIRYPLKTT
jgi:hypothetical protein